jgi:hypothetical protein
MKRRRLWYRYQSRGRSLSLSQLEMFRRPYLRNAKKIHIPIVNAAATAVR